MSVATLLVLVALALLAVAALAPRAPRGAPAVSLAPPLAAFPVERWSPPVAEDEPASALAEATWPERVDPRARGCDAGARLALVDALAGARSAWAAELLLAARDDEPDPEVRAAISAALAQTARM